LIKLNGIYSNFVEMQSIKKWNTSKIKHTFTR
jgi:hypothetical protein